jgi:hypothetical protein
MIEPFEIEVCALSGDPGCLGWPNGFHEGSCEYATATFHRCSECGGDDVYSSDGLVYHEENCAATRSLGDADGK